MSYFRIYYYDIDVYLFIWLYIYQDFFLILFIFKILNFLIHFIKKF